MIATDVQFQTALELILLMEQDEIEIVQQLSDEQLRRLVDGLTQRGYTVIHTSKAETFDVYTIKAVRHRRSGAVFGGGR